MNNRKKESKLESTGERYLPHLVGDVQLEHYHRYLLASTFASGKKVLDIACGEGYGSNLLADVAVSVTGVDISQKTIDHANIHYQKPNLMFVQGSCADIPLKKNSVDVVISFETIEHLDQHEAMLQEIKRVLKSDGLLIISTPDKKEYSDIPEYTNQFHIKELYFSEFEDLLKSQFKNVTLLGQRVKFGSLIAPTDRKRMAKFLPFDKENYNSEDFRPLYLIAIASNKKIDDEIVSIYSSPFEETEFAQTFYNKLEQLNTHLQQTQQTVKERNGKIKKIKRDLDKQCLKNQELKDQLAAQTEVFQELTYRLEKAEAELSTKSESYKKLDAEFEEIKKREHDLSLEIEKTQKLLSETSHAHNVLLEEFEERGHWALGLLKDLEQTRNSLNELLESNSIRVTAPLRYTRRLADRFSKYNKDLMATVLKTIYTRLPLPQYIKIKLKSFTFNRFEFLLKGTRAYDNWLEATQEQASASQNKNQETSATAEDVSNVFSFQTVSSPDVSIIIPVYGNIDYTYHCLHSIYKVSSNYNFEIIVVDDCSEDHTREVLSQVKGVRLIKNKETLGFIRSCNKGASKARGKYTLFLNNDTQVLPDWLDELVKTFEAHPEAGLVGSKLIYPSVKLQEAGGVIWKNGTGWNYGRNDDPDKPQYNFLREVDYCSGASLMVPTSLFKSLGGFDERYVPAYYEDVDLAFTVRKHGKKVLYQPLSKVVHFEGVTSGTDITQGAKSFQEVNRPKFAKKWDAVLQNHGMPEDNGACAPERGIHKRILVIDTTTPTPDQDAGSVKALNYMKIFKDLSFRITFIPVDNFAHMEKYTFDLQRMGIECLWSPYVLNLESYLKSNGEQYDVVLIYRAYCAHNNIDNIRKYCPNAKIIFNTVDLHYLREQRQASIENCKVLEEQSESTKEIELEVMKKADATIVLSKVERSMVLEQVPNLNVRTIPLVLDAPGSDVPYAKRKNILFIGGFQHKPNLDAVKYFVSEIWPLIRFKFPELKFYIVGSNMPQEIRLLAGNGVHPVGFVEDLSKYFNRCLLSVAPLRYGAGLKGKVAESMGWGVPCVASTLAVEGMDIASHKEFFVADEPTDFARTVCRLLQNEDDWNTVAEFGVEFVRNNYSLEICRKKLTCLMDDLEVFSNETKSLEISRINSFEEYQAYHKSMKEVLTERTQYEKKLVEKGNFSHIPGFCYVCKRKVNFSICQNTPLEESNEHLIPNFREQLQCPGCGLNNRMRAAIQIFEQTARAQKNQSIYILEQISPLFTWLSNHYNHVYGSEYLGNEIPFGEANCDGIRNESITRLTFKDESLDFILSFDIFEHIPDYSKAIQESLRCLKPGGRLLLSVPFAGNSETNIVRAEVNSLGKLNFLYPPEYHGDPLNQQGCLCFYHFGWELLDELKSEGFTNVSSYFYWSKTLGYLGSEQMIILAEKTSTS